jgi:hypothetical protein
MNHLLQSVSFTAYAIGRGNEDMIIRIGIVLMAVMLVAFITIEIIFWRMNNRKRK